MARYVLIVIEDNGVAEQYVESLRSGKQFITVPTSNAAGEQDQYQVVELNATVAGLYGKPVSFCECPAPGKRLRGAKLGWWVCTNKDCNKPVKGAPQMPNNLLEVDRHPRERTTYIHITAEGFAEWVADHPGVDLKI